MRLKIWTNLIFYVLAFVLIALALVCFVFYKVHYDTLIDYVLQQIDRTDLKNIITQKYFTLTKFELLQSISFLVSGLSCILFWALFKYRLHFKNHVEKGLLAIFTLNNHFWKSVVQNSRSVNALLALSIILILARSIYYATYFYLQYDEAWNYNYFLQHNILYTCFAYNNYPLHNIITWCFVHIFSSSALILRAPSILIGLLNCLLVFVVTKKMFESEWIALANMLLFACLPISVFYMMYSRGVILEMFFSLLIFYLLFSYIKGGISIKKIIFLAILNALGTYSMLSHVYFIACSIAIIFCYQLLQKEKQFKLLIFYPILSILFSALLLLPMMVGTGISLGLSAATGQSNNLTLHMRPFHCYSDVISGWWFMFYFFIALNFIILFIRRFSNMNFLILTNLILLIAPILIKLATGIFPPERSLAFLYLIPIFSFALLLRYLPFQKIFLTLTTLVVIICLSYITFYHKKLNWSKELDKQVCKLSQVLISEKVNSIHSTTPRFNYFVPGLQYYFYKNKQVLSFTSTDSRSTRHDESAKADCKVTDIFTGNEHLMFSYDSLFVYDTR